MQRHPLSTILARPALHLLLALGFAVVFCWPILAMTRPAQTFHFLYVSWIFSLVALFAISRGTADDSAEMPEQEREEAVEGLPGGEQHERASGADRERDVTRESL